MGPANGAASVLAEQLWIWQVTYRKPAGEKGRPRGGEARGGEARGGEVHGLPAAPRPAGDRLGGRSARGRSWLCGMSTPRGARAGCGFGGLARGPSCCWVGRLCASAPLPTAPEPSGSHRGPSYGWGDRG